MKTPPSPSFSAATIDGLVEDFCNEALVVESSFRKLGKIYHLIESHGATPYPLLLARGVSKGTISNASYGARVWGLVQSGTVAETLYWTLPFRDIVKLAQGKNEKEKCAHRTHQSNDEKLEDVELFLEDLSGVKKGDRERLRKLLLLAQNALLAARECLEESDREINELISAALRPIGNARFGAGQK